MEVDLIPVDALVPYARNPRRNDNAVDAVAASIKEFGFRQPIVVDEDMVILVGHTRHKAAKKLGMAQVPVHVATGLTDAQKKAYRIADNRTNEIAEWDNDLLALELEELRMADFDLGTLAFDEGEIDELMASLDATPEGQTEDDDVPEPPAVPVSKPGDVWLLGNHRLMCGDSTDAAAVATLMNGEQVRLVVTDPPYGVSYSDKNKYLNAIDRGNRIQSSIANDHLCKEETKIMWKSAFSRMSEVMAPGAVVYCFMPQGGDQMMMMMMMTGAGIEPRHELIWVKNNHVLGRTDYAYKHEPILYAWKAGGHKFYGDFQTSIFEYPKPQKSDLHPTMKPVALVEKLISNSSQAGDSIYEPFSGSGTTIIAAQKTGRRCYAMELAPEYVDVAVRRWQDFTGKTATLESTGEAFPVPPKVDADGTVCL